MKFDVRVAFAIVALVLGACQGGLDSGGGMPGMMGPPVSQPGPMGTGEMQGPTINANGQPTLQMPGATLAPNQSQFAVGDAPNGVKCPLFQQYTCSLSFNMPTPSPPPSPGQTPKPTPSPTPSPNPSSSASSDEGDDSGDAPNATPTPPGTITLQMEPLPNDVPSMMNPDPRAQRITPLVAIRLQSNTNFSLNGLAAVQYSLPPQQMLSRSFAIQLYNETAIRGKRTDQYLATYSKYDSTSAGVSFNFATPRVTVKSGQIWLLALYGFQYPPGTTPTPSPAPASSASASASPSPAPST